MGATIWRFCQPQSWTKPHILRPYIQEADRQKLNMLMCKMKAKVNPPNFNNNNTLKLYVKTYIS